MKFNKEKAIFIQIADFLVENILDGKWEAESRVPSVRDMAVSVEVNPNTVLRAYTYLQDQGIIFNLRGKGYFVTPLAVKNILVLKKDEFIRNDVPKLKRMMSLLRIDFAELKKICEKTV